MDTLADVARTFLVVIWQEHDDFCHRFEDEVFEFNVMGMSKLGRTIEDMLEDGERAKGKLNDEINLLVESVAKCKGQTDVVEEVEKEGRWKSKVRRRSTKSLRRPIRYKRLKTNGITNNNKPNTVMSCVK